MTSYMDGPLCKLTLSPEAKGYSLFFFLLKHKSDGRLYKYVGRRGFSSFFSSGFGMKNKNGTRFEINRRRKGSFSISNP